MKALDKICLILLFGLYFIVVYFGINDLTGSRGVYFVPLFSWEKDIPFLPTTYLFYGLCYVLPVSAFMVVKKKEDLWRMFAVYMILISSHAVIWMLLPVKNVIRPSLNGLPDTFLGEFIHLTYMLDYPAMNCFPSLHVSLAFVTYFAVKVFRKDLEGVYFILAVAISVSTLTVKQHYFVDVVGGVFMSWLGYGMLKAKGGLMQRLKGAPRTSDVRR